MKLNKPTYRVNYFSGLLIVLVLFAFSCAKEQAIPVNVDYEVMVVDNDYSAPVMVKINNETTGADTYQWTLEGSTSNTMNTSRNPGTIVYEKGGDYLIKLEASNQDGERDVKTFPITVYDGIVLDFDIEVVKNNFPPVEVKLINKTKGASTYQWTFTNGNPKTSTAKHPTNVTFTQPGKHTITLKAGTDFESFTMQKTITVNPYLEVDFGWEVAFQDEDHQAPVTLTMTNSSISATQYRWTFEGGQPETSNRKNPMVTFSDPGVHSITLKASNGKQTKEITKTFEVLPNTNLRVFKDVKLGIHTAHRNNSTGAFFSTITRQVYAKAEVTQDVGKTIDIVFFGLNESFDYNKFVSPDEVTQETTFAKIPMAKPTKFINSLKNCACGAALSVEEFDYMTNDQLLRKLEIKETNAGSQHFTDQMKPRIILFQTADGRKGAIKLKEFVKKGSDSYVLMDIKVQKQPI